MNKEQTFYKALMSYNKLSCSQLVKTEINDNEPFKIIESLIVPVLERIGNEWASGDASLSQVYMSGKICEQLIDEILPPNSHLRKNSPCIAIAVLEDHHTLGKRVIYSCLKASGYKITDLGVCSVDELFDAVSSNEFELLLISTLMLPSALHIKTFIDKMTEHNIDVPVIAGGAPFNFDDELCAEVGAYATAENIQQLLKLMENVEKYGVKK